MKAAKHDLDLIWLAQFLLTREANIKYLRIMTHALAVYRHATIDTLAEATVAYHRVMADTMADMLELKK